MDYVNCSGKGSRAVEIHHLSKSHIGRLKDHKFKSQEIGSLTVSNWFKVTLELAQITALWGYSGHLIRPASISKDDLAGLCLFRSVYSCLWSDTSTWQRFYHKKVIAPEHLVQENVFSSAQKGSSKAEKRIRDQVWSRELVENSVLDRLRFYGVKL